MTERRQALLTRLGFRFGINGPHAARTMMLDDLRALLAHTPAMASKADYVCAVMDSNVLGKPTRKARELTLRHMASLYALDPANPIFRALRHLWPMDESAQPMLALSAALARDPLLRNTQAFVLGLQLGKPLPRESVEVFLDSAYRDRFSPSSLKSFSQNVAGTWTAAGLLRGRTRKTRSLPEPGPVSAAMLLFLGFLEGRTGERLFSSDWAHLLCVPKAEFESLASSASLRGLLVFMNAGGVKEVRFPGYLSTEEEKIRQEVSLVI